MDALAAAQPTATVFQCITMEGWVEVMYDVRTDKYPLSLSFQTENLHFLQILPTAAFLFLLQDYYVIPQSFTVTSEHIRFLHFSFSVFVSTF